MMCFDPVASENFLSFMILTSFFYPLLIHLGSQMLHLSSTSAIFLKSNIRDFPSLLVRTFSLNENCRKLKRKVHFSLSRNFFIKGDISENMESDENLRESSIKMRGYSPTLLLSLWIRSNKNPNQKLLGCISLKLILIENAFLRYLEWQIKF